MKKIILIYCFLVLISCKGQRDEIKNTTKQEDKIDNISNYNSRKYTPLELLKCKTNISDSNYTLSCNNLEIHNNIFNSSDQSTYELITLKFKDIEKAIIRKINSQDLPTSNVIIYSNKLNKNLILFFPLVGENNFGWKIYYYKDKVLYPVGQRIIYWKAEYEESEIKYQDIIKLEQSNNLLRVEIPNKYIINKNEEYLNYPNYSDGKFSEGNGNSYYEFQLSNLNYYKKYDNGLIEGDYNKMINNKIIYFLQ